MGELGVWVGNRSKLLNFGGDPDHHVDCPTGSVAFSQKVMDRLQ